MYEVFKATQNIFMKRLYVLLALSVALVFGLSPVAHAQHCNVKSGDSMWKIAKRYRCNFSELLKMNKHYPNPHLIHPKDKVELPDGSTGQTTNENSRQDDIADEENTLTEQGSTSEATAILELVNKERSKNGLNPLTLSQELTNVATIKAKDMRDNNYFSHTSPTYGSPFDMLQHFGIHYSYAGENIASGQKTPEQVMTDWLNSSGHRANILNKNYTQLGVGYVEGGNYGNEWVQLFLKP